LTLAPVGGLFRIGKGGQAMKVARVQSVCECEARLGAELDEQHLVVRGFAQNGVPSEQLVAPANTLGADGERFDVTWFCPFCTRNVLRSFRASGLSFREA
jgi:hypothetical protein